MRCPSCGAKCRSDRRHCPKCGVPLDPRVAAFGGAARGVREAWGLEAREETAVASPRRTPYVRFVVAAVALVAVLFAVILGLQLSSAPGRQRLETEGFGGGSLASALAAYDTDGDGSISASEAAAVTELDCSGMGLTSLDGIELFTNLQVLDASDNGLSSVDLSALGRLSELDLSGNAVSELDLSGHAGLVELDVSGNGMTSLDLSGCGALLVLHCAGNDLARLNLADCTSLTELVCDAGQNVTVPIAAGFFPDAGLRSALAVADTDGDGALTLREREALTSLTVDDPATESLYGLAWFPNLAELDASGTALSEIDTSTLPGSLVTLVARDCLITSVNLTGELHLATLDLSGNPLEAADVSALARLTSLDLSDCALTGTLDVTANVRLESLDVTGNPDLAAVDATGVAGLAREGAVAADDGCAVAVGAVAVPGDATAEDAQGAAEAAGDAGAGDVQEGA